MIVEGASDEEIIGYLTPRYGDFVLYRPPFRATTALLWLSPLVLLLLAIGIAWRVLRPGNRGAVAPADEESRARIRARLEKPE